MDRRDIVDVLEEIGTLLELKGENAFKVRAYQNGARALETLDGDLGELIESSSLTKVKGIGEALAKKIITLHETGELTYYTELKESVPGGLLEMLEIPGMGAKKIKALHEELGVDSIASLQEAAEEGKVAGLSGFGKKSQEKILQGIEKREAYAARHYWPEAAAVAEPILEGLRDLEAVERAEVAGSFRRRADTVGDLDFIVASEDPEPVMDWFTGQDAVESVTARGSTKSSVRFEGGLQADLRVVPPAQFTFALHHFTGSKDHNVAMRQRALSRGYSLSEWGLFDKETDFGETPPPERRSAVEAEDEAELFSFLGLNFIPPELREGLDEIGTMEEREAPELIRLDDIRGVFHNHTTASDGRHSLEEMARAAADRGWEYLGFADHSKASFQANGLDEERVETQRRKIEAYRDSGDCPIHLFTGIECDILPDGSLDLEDAVLESLDYVVVSVHSSMTQSEAEMTKRLIRAIEHPLSTMVGHLTGRILLRREGYAVNVGKVIDAAVANDTLIELNAHPSRLDMEWRHWKRAVEKGLLCVINPDAHEKEGFGVMRSGINAARKGWLRKEDVLNTRSLADVKRWLAERG